MGRRERKKERYPHGLERSELGPFSWQCPTDSHYLEVSFGVDLKIFYVIEGK